MNVPERATEIKATIAAVIALLTALWGWTGWAVVIWIACVALDYISGTAAAKAAHAWSSEEARAGLWHKLGEILAVLVAALCDIALSVVVEGSGVKLPIQIGPLVTPVVLLWYILTELGSIIENAGKLGAPVPSWFKKSITDAKDKIDDERGAGSEKENAAGTYAPRHDGQAAETKEKPPDWTGGATWDD